MLDFIINPLFLTLVALLIVFLIAVVWCRKTGSPQFMRGWIGVRGAFPVVVLVKEKRGNECKVYLTRGRRFIRPDKTEVYQTIQYGDIPAPKLEEVDETEQMFGLVELVKLGAEDFRPLKTIVTETGDFKQKPMSMEQKIFYRDQAIDSTIKYKSKAERWTKVLPILIIFFTALGLTILVWFNTSQLVEVSENNARLGETMDSMSGKIADIVRIIYRQPLNVSSPFTNYSY